MDKPYDSLDQHFNLPHIRSIGTDRPMQWLRMAGTTCARTSVPAFLMA